MPKPTASSPPEPNLKRAVSLVTQMMAIPGPSGREGRIIRFIIDRLRRAGLPATAAKTDRVHRVSRIGGQTGSLIVKLPGTIRGPRRLLMAHVDTVPICVGSRPVRRGGVIQSQNKSTGLGADNRSGAAAILTAALEVLRRKLPHPPLTFFFPVQEEIGLVGARHVPLRVLGGPRLAFNFDSGEGIQLVVGATGAYRMSIEVTGVASHAGVHPQNGVSAIAIAALAIARLQEEGWHGAILKGRRRGTSNIGLIDGGSASNVVAPRVTIAAEARSHDGRFRKRILDQIVDSFKIATAQVRSASGRRGKIRVDSRLDYESFRLSKKLPCVAAAESAVRACGGEPHHVVVDGGLDANWITARGIPTITLGAGQHHAHTVDEILDINEFEMGCRIALRLATGTEGP